MCTYFGPKLSADAGHALHYNIHSLIAWTIFLVTWGVIIAWTIFLVTWGVKSNYSSLGGTSDGAPQLSME